MSIGLKIKERRQELGLDQPGLIDLLAKNGLSVSQQTISKWENGKADPNRNNLSVIAKSMGKHEAWFLGIDTMEKVIETVEVETETQKLIRRLINEGIIKPGERISAEKANIILNAVQTDIDLLFLKEKQGD